MVSKIIGETITSSDLFTVTLKTKASVIVGDSGRRYEVPLVKRAKYKKTFIPNAIGILNRILK